MLAGKFQKAITGLGMERLEHPLFYHAPVGLRFEIGGEEPIYLDRSAAKLKTNPAYVQGALDRAVVLTRRACARVETSSINIHKIPTHQLLQP